MTKLKNNKNELKITGRKLNQIKGKKENWNIFRLNTLF